MAQELSDFEKLDEFPNVYCARKGTLRSTAIELGKGKLCLHSPIAGLSRQARSSLKEIGEVQFLLAPNHYHNKGLLEYAAAFPDAVLIALPTAIPRLQKITGLTFEDAELLLPYLPGGASILFPQGLKTGEIWLRFETDMRVAWLVVDAICTMKENAKAPVSDTPEILGTFPKMGVADKTIYRNWVEQQIAADQPSTVIPCHGSIIRADDLPAKLRDTLSVFA